MTEFVSKLEEILEAEELLFDPTPGFGGFCSRRSIRVCRSCGMSTLLLRERR